LLTLAAVGAVMLDLLASGRVHPTGLGGLVVLGLLAAAHGHLLSMQARSEVRQMVEIEQSMRHRAFHDDLTGLANRALFLDRLTHALDLHRRHRLPVSVLYCDLDGFKRVNDRHGHLVGDALLAAVATRLRQCLRPEDTLARLGGDEFGLLLEHASSSDVVADRLREALIEPFTVAGLTLRLGMSIGSTRVEPHDPTPSPQEVLERADADMYVAKSTRLPRAAPAPRSPEPDLAAALARGLHSGEVSVVYQPLVDAATGAVHGTEALARWRHDGRVLLPEVFVELAERVGLSDALTDVVLEQSCAQLSTWSAAAGHRRLTMSVNVSPSQIVDPTLPARVRAVVDRHGLDHEQVVLETTVAAVTAGSQTGASTGVGLRLSLGGFTGAPDEFALLSALPVRSVKVAGAHAADDERLLHVLVALGRELDVAVVVERVERPDELAVLRTLTGVLAQGYLLSKPSEAAALDELVLRGCPLPV
jgi:diguanylate cyclase (GGDEF)-like protein